MFDNENDRNLNNSETTRDNRPHGTEIRVEKKRGFNPLWLLVPLGIAGLVALSNVDRDDNRDAAYYNQDRNQVAEANFQNRRWVPAGQVVTMADQQMAVVGRSTEGHTLYARQGQNFQGGGGGGAAQTAYLRTGVNTYQPMIAR